MRRINFFNRFLFSVLLAITVVSFPLSTVRSQTSDAGQKASQLLQTLTPEQRVGQLFLVTFNGSTALPGSDIYKLITSYGVGGVVLKAQNDNFIGPVDTTLQAAELINSLQRNVWEVSLENAGDGGSPAADSAPFIPLFVGVSQEGDQTPNDQILAGMSALPNLMAIGATWQTSYAEQAGKVMGQELSALGFNLYLGPSVDVLDVLQTGSGEDLGTRTFGSDPYWVARMGESYIRGLHLGSQNQLAVIAKHFPGRGGSDRPPTEEVATVRKSLEQLKQLELAPFFSITGSAKTPEGIANGLLVSHIRYQGFQGNIRATTRPVSFDQTALEQILSLADFTTWRSNGGIIVSDDLGSAAVRRFYSPTGATFDARQVVRTAFLAGNDLLYMDKILSSGDADTYTTITRTLEFFAQKYREDPAFAQRVDASVLRLLTLKYQLYGDFLLENLLSAPEEVAEVGASQGIGFEIAQNAATLISPDAAELVTALGAPPDQRDRIVFFTDIQSGRQCSTCTEELILGKEALMNAVLRLYGPSASGQVQPYNLNSFSFSELIDLIDGIQELPEDMEANVRAADWLVFSMVNSRSGQPGSAALQRILSERPDLLQGKRIIAFAFNAPYFLDATDISKLTAYYGLYSKTPAFVDVAARLLMQEMTPVGALPVSVPSVGYDLIQITMPDPQQVIPLLIDQGGNSPGGETTSSDDSPRFSVGDVLPLVTGKILDHNDHIVPDGTVVRFLFTLGGEGGTAQQIETVTTEGVARATYPIQTQGLLEIRAVSDPATVSQILRLDIRSNQAAAVTAIVPTPILTEIAQPTLTPSATMEITQVLIEEQPNKPGFSDWLLSMVIVWVSGLGVYWLGSRLLSMKWGMRWGLLAVCGGLLSYLLLSINYGSSPHWKQFGDPAAPIILIILGIFAGWVGGLFWWQLGERQKQK
jgi:beta-N-acetylhexosaminidase